MLNEKTLARMMKEAWKTGGYIVGCFTLEDDEMILLTDPNRWTVVCELVNMPRKCLGQIVEHIGCIPKNEAMRCMKDAEQAVVLDMAKGLYDDLLQTKQLASGMMMRTGVTIGGRRIWQDADSWQLKLMDEAAGICKYSDDDVEPMLAENGILFDMTDALVFVREDETEEYEHILKALGKFRI